MKPEPRPLCLRTLLILLISVWICPYLQADPSAAPPNVVVILADDLGFSDLGCYGSEISTPNLDGLAANGLRFTQCYNTARCWPTRAAILTGYYPQQINMDPPKGPMPNWSRPLPQLLRPAGYRSYHSGKWHVQTLPRPVADGGFDRSYSLEDHDRYFSPKNTLKDDKRQPPVEKNSAYYATTAVADHAIECLKEHSTSSPDRPFYSYIAFTAPHFPLHAPAKDIERYQSRYHYGWNTLQSERSKKMNAMGIVDCQTAPMDSAFTPRYWKKDWPGILGDGELEHPLPWAQLTEEQKQFQSWKMAIHAAMIDRMDQEIGRIFDQLKAMGAWENTLVVFLSDNGADATILVRGDGHERSASPGSGESYLCLGPGWASASNTPFRMHKIWTHEGGISTPLIAHWPAGVRAHNELRTDVAHVVDILPTILDLAGISNPRDPSSPKRPGMSLVPAFAKNGALGPRELFFKHEGNRALRLGDEKLVSSKENKDAWELFDLSTDRSELHDLAEKNPARVKSLASRWKELDAQFAADAKKACPPPDSTK